MGREQVVEQNTLAASISGISIKETSRSGKEERPKKLIMFGHIISLTTYRFVRVRWLIADLVKLFPVVTSGFTLWGVAVKLESCFSIHHD